MRIIPPKIAKIHIAKDISAFRREHLGFVFQDFNLLDTLSVRDNIYLPMVLSKAPVKKMKARLENLAPKLNIATSFFPTRFCFS
ncbi:hypothetical protein N568_0111725 [Lactococcus garvieae TRF1]|uniref:ABC transporter domain-containing protein n=1 Tax=Lactococcus garvieae TRF1 TaxID=1380772 RepID=V8ALC0_9LACT|nr:hypothetical protein N568_0111725 [Lactococcus garvieae TRF1]